MSLQNIGMPLRSEKYKTSRSVGLTDVTGNVNDFSFHTFLDFLYFGDRPFCWPCKAQVTSSVQLSPWSQGSAVLGQCARDKCF